MAGIILALGAATSPGAAAQERARHSVEGRVVDSASGAALSTAWVDFADGGRRLGVDAAGTFRVVLESGRRSLRIHALGYETRELAVDIRSDTSLVIALRIQPLALEGIEVQTDRLARRARALPWQVRRVTRDDLLDSAAPTPVDELNGRFLQLLPCRGGGTDCIRWRGAYTTWFMDRVREGRLSFRSSLRVDRPEC